MSENNGVIFLRSYYEAIKSLPKKEQNRMYSCIFEYVFEDISPDLPSKLVPIWTLIKPNLDSSARRYNASKANSFKGGRPAKEGQEKNLSKKPKPKPTEKPTPFIDMDMETEMDMETDIYISSPAALSLSEDERKAIEKLCGDKTDFLLENVQTWLDAGHETTSLYNTCLTFFRNNPKVFTGQPLREDASGRDYTIEDEPVFVTGADGYETAIVKRYKVYKDGRKEQIDGTE